MHWRTLMDFKNIIKEALPFIGTALLGPLGGGAANFIASKLGTDPANITNTIGAMLGDPTQATKLREIELEYQQHCMSLGYQSIKDIEDINAAVVKEVNKTMQSEAAAEHWPTYSWRPFIGFSFGLYINSMWLLPLFKITPTVLSPDTVLAIGGVLGVASWFRGKMQADPTIPTINKG